MPGPTPVRGTLATLIRAAATDQRLQGWLYLQSDRTEPETSCLLLIGDEDTEKLAAFAWSLGFRSLGLRAQDLKDYFEWANELVEHDPSDAELARFFWYYFATDQVMPSMDTPNLPPFIQSEVDRDFYDSLGAEREGIACRSTGCQRGAVALSVFCRTHHFERIVRRPCPFGD
jgi:hypothetical protein